MGDNKLLGDLGESLATGLLYSKGYSILETKYKCKTGEVDIICAKEDEISFVEVKTRQSLALGRPAEAVTAAKQRKIRNGANFYLSTHYRNEEKVNFQVIEILINQINYAF